MEKIGRSEAIEKGLARYFTGKPCVNGHISERLSASAKCIECKRADYDPVRARKYNAAYRARNADKLLRYDRERSSSEVGRLKRKLRDKARADAFVGPPNHPRKKRSPEAARLKRAEEWASYYQRNKDALAEKSKAYREKNGDVVRARVRAWSAENQHRRTALQQKRKANKMRAVPVWHGELDDLAWVEAADLVRLRRASTGTDWASDHMIPLAGRSACGLHVWNNCQVIPWALNQSKNNRLILTEPLEWLKFI
jgi:hypothetical protein